MNANFRYIFKTPKGYLISINHLDEMILTSDKAQATDFSERDIKFIQSRTSGEAIKVSKNH